VSVNVVTNGNKQAPFILGVYECKNCGKEIEKWELKDKEKHKEILEAEYDYDYYKETCFHAH
jgi:hypothetical protein